MIRIVELTKRYGRKAVLAGVTLCVERGEVLALIGPNGSGKSTTLKAAVGLVRPTSGSISIDGLDLLTRRADALAHSSFLPQHPAFPEALTGHEVLRFYSRLRGLDHDRLERARELSGLGEALHRPAGEYSGGMTQRLAVAVLSLPDAPALLLDEPSEGLDPRGVARLHGWLKEERGRGKAVLFTTHRLAEAEELADRVLVLSEGCVAASLCRDDLSGPERATIALDPRETTASIRPFRSRLLAEVERLHGEAASDV